MSVLKCIVHDAGRHHHWSGFAKKFTLSSSLPMSLRLVLAAIVFVVTSSLTLQFASAKDCLNYEPTVVTLTGKISRHLEYGTPGFGESPGTDAKEIYWYLDLDKAVCTAATAADEDTPEGQGEEDIRRLQIVFLNGYPHGGDWIGHTASITGTLFHAITGHHHTPVLIIAKQTKKLPTILVRPN